MRRLAAEIVPRPSLTLPSSSAPERRGTDGTRGRASARAEKRPLTPPSQARPHPDGRYVIIDGRRRRATDPAVPEDVAARPRFLAVPNPAGPS